MFGNHHPKLSKNKISDKLKNTLKLKCAHCSKEFYPWCYVRSHGDNCKRKIIS